MNSLTTPHARILDIGLNVGAPLSAIAMLATYHQVPIGALLTVWAAVLTGLFVPVLARLVIKPFLTACEVQYPSGTACVFMAVCNFALGAVCMLVVLRN